MKFCKDCWNFGRCNAIGRTVGFAVDDGVCIDFDECKPMTNADRMIEMLKTNDAETLLDWWEEIFEDGVPSADYFKWWLQQPAEGD